MVSSLPNTFHPLFNLAEYNLHTAILYTLAYSDVFDFPLNQREIHRYLIGFKANPDQVGNKLTELHQKGLLTNRDELYAFPGREKNFTLRLKRAELSTNLWSDAIRYGMWIARLPNIRMVAVTGALSSNNVDAGADLDYFIITKPGWLWTTRAMILAIDRVSARFGSRAHICPNYMITSRSLALDEEDLFTAQEMARMVPLAGLNWYNNFRQENKWTEQFLPNAKGSPSQTPNRSVDGKTQNVAERVWNNPVSRRIEKWEMHRKIRKFSALAVGNDELRFSSDLCKGHFDGHKHQTLLEFQNRIQSLGIANG